MQLVPDVEAAPAFAMPDIRSRKQKAPFRILLHGKDGSPNNFVVLMSHFDDPAPTPRHRHNFEQIRIAVTGEFEYGPGQSFGAGEIMYFPESASYGPQVRRDCLMFTIQFGGASGLGYISEAQCRDGYAALAKRGALKEGVFSYVDADGKRHNRDAFEALWEEINGREIVYPEPRYDGVILMKPENYAWVDSKTEPGVAHKWLGRFTERDLRVGLVRIGRGAAWTIPAADAPQIVLMRSGAVSHAGRQLGKGVRSAWRRRKGRSCSRAKARASSIS